MSKFSAAALLIIDVQKAIDSPYHAVEVQMRSAHRAS
jgi:hypothetical protein